MIAFLMGNVPVKAQALIGDSISRQAAFKVKRMAVQSVKYGDTYSAIELYELYLRKRPKKLHARFELGKLYFQVRDYRSAERHLSGLTKADSNAFPEAWFYRGRSLKSLGNYTLASTCFEEFKDRYRGLKNRRTYRRLLKAEFAILDRIDSIQHNLLPAEVKPIHTLNQRATESGPWLLDWNTLLFTAKPEDNLEVIPMKDSVPDLQRTRIYTANLTEGSWTKKGLLAGTINDLEGHVGNPAVTHDDRYMFFSVCTENWQGETICHLYQSRRVNDEWKRIEKLGDGINLRGFQSTQPAVGRDVDRNRYILYFVSDRPGGKGGKDIWYTQYNKRDDEWSKPRNCGSKVNTVGNEETPWIDLDEGTLYFSSDGHPGIGGMDIYRSYGEKSRWSEPQLLGMPINSPADDTYYRKQPRERYMLLTSNREGSQSLWAGTCCDDLYEVFYPEDFQSILRLTAYEVPDEGDDMDGRARLEETVFKLYVIDPKTKEKFFVKSDTAHDGQVDLTFEPGKIYSVEGTRPGYFSDIQLIDTRTTHVNDTVDLDLNLKRWDEQPIRIPDIFFEFNSDKLTEDSKLALDTSIYQLMVDNPEIIVEIMAHTDSKGTDSYNKNLSQDRAESVVSYLQDKGIERDRLVAAGYGEEQPIAPNTHPDGSDNPEGRAKNRRVEFRVTGTKLRIERYE